MTTHYLEAERILFAPTRDKTLHTTDALLAAVGHALLAVSGRLDARTENPA